MSQKIAYSSPSSGIYTYIDTNYSRICRGFQNPCYNKYIYNRYIIYNIYIDNKYFKVFIIINNSNNLFKQIIAYRNK